MAPAMLKIWTKIVEFSHEIVIQPLATANCLSVPCAIITTSTKEVVFSLAFVCL